MINYFKSNYKKELYYDVWRFKEKREREGGINIEITRWYLEMSFRNSSKDRGGGGNYRKVAAYAIYRLLRKNRVVCAYRIYPVGKKKQWRRWLIHSISDSWMLDWKMASTPSRSYSPLSLLCRFPLFPLCLPGSFLFFPPHAPSFLHISEIPPSLASHPFLPFVWIIIHPSTISLYY